MLILTTPRRRPRLPLAVAALGLVAVVAAWLGTDALPPAADASPAPAPHAAAAAAARPAAVPTLPPRAAAAPQDDPARVFDIGFAGGLIVDPSTLASLDALQSLVGENPSPDALARLEYQLRQGLPREAADQAIALFNGYRGYSAAMRQQMGTLTAVPQTRGEVEALAARLEALQARHFDAESADSLFSAQNRLSRATLEAMLVQSDPRLSEPAKRARIDALRASLPEAQRGAIAELPTAPAAVPGALTPTMPLTQ